MSTETEITIPPAALEALAIFPLPGVVLLPGGVLPLHIFEPRYRELTRDALNGSELIAMTRIVETSDETPPSVYPVAGLGRVIGSRELEDGRFFILLRGIARVRIAEELETNRSYRVVRAELLPDLELVNPQLTLAAEAQLTSMCEQLARSIDPSSDLLEMIRSGDTPGRRADVLASALVRNPDDRQALLELRDPGRRIEMLLELVARAMAAAGNQRQMN